MKNTFSSVLFSTLFFTLFASNFVNARCVADSSYFPLFLGSQWAYASQSFPHTEQIADTSTIHGKLYYGLTIWSDYAGFWFRFSNDSVFVVNAETYNDSSESLLYNFGGNVGDTVHLPPLYGCSFGVKVVLVGKQDTVTTPAGTFANCFHFLHVVWCMDGGIQESWFAKGVGRIKYSEESISGLRTYTVSSYNLATGVPHLQAKTTASSHRLLNSYPNPFNPQTSLSYHIHETSQVSLTIVDLLGRQVASLVNGLRLPGDYLASWNASSFPSGIYFAVLRVHNFSETKKLILQK
jgi:hypothetical protein